MKIGILGGTFNPPHTGHLILAEGVKEKLKLEKIIFVPANIPPLKEEKELIDAKIRLKMINLSIKGNKHFASSKIEIERKGVSYTFETIKKIKETFGVNSRLFFIAGSDVLENINLWKNKEELFKLSTFIAVTRKGFKMPSSLPQNIETLEMNTIEISSSQIREKIKNGESIRYLVCEPVRLIIERKKLYLT
ncbi:MAG: nicotinate-nucleotide adenylyltransferase [Candidatus Omnitrophota bacterium]